MGEVCRATRSEGGKTITVCTLHDKPLEWIVTGTGRSKFTCPDCEDGVRPQGEGPKFPLIRWGQTFWRDRELTPKERANPPRRVGD